MSHAPAFAPKALRRGLAVAFAEAETERAGEAARERACGGVRGAKPLGQDKEMRFLVARTSWFDEKAGHEAIQDRVSKLDTFTSALADGVVTKQELTGQEQRLIAAMKTVEGELNDAAHAKVTTLLVELTAYNIMRLLHELHTERVRMSFASS